MKRDLGLLDGKTFDVVIIGGGIYGACLAWEAISRGLSVALIEKNDFASGTSANSLKIIHGGLRYLQHLDIQRFRESTRERTTLMNIAPHLVHPLPVVIPTYGHGLRGKEVMLGALLVNHWLGLDCKQTWDPSRRVPWGKLLSSSHIHHMLPFISHEGLSGGALFYDAQVYNSERLVLSFLHSAAAYGAVLGNYIEAKAFLQKHNRVMGVQVQDKISGETFDVLSKTVVNTVGPWSPELQEKLTGKTFQCRAGYVKAVNVLMKPLVDSFAFGMPIPSTARDERAVVDRGSRMLFVAPWRGYSLVGTIYIPFNDAADDCVVTQKDVSELLNLIAQACPSLHLQRQDVRFVHGGLLPCTRPAHRPEDIQLLNKYEIYDHRIDRLEGMLSVTGVKYTTARFVAQKTIDHIIEREGTLGPSSRTASTPVFGGDIDRFEAYLDQEIQANAESINESGLQSLICNYGTAYKKVLSYIPCKQLSQGQRPCKDFDVLRGQVRFAVREEMAYKLTDVVFRRTEIGSAGDPGEKALEVCAYEMGSELGWGSQKVHEEIRATCEQFVVAA